MKMKKLVLVALALLSGIILSIAWPERGFPGLLFIGFIPLLYLEDYIYNHPDKFIRFSVLFYTLPGFLLWNLLTTWWIVNSTLIGAIMAILLNSLFMAIIFQAFHYTRRKLKNPMAGIIALISFWIAFEYLHLNWDLNWPWLNLGNGFAVYYKWVQWYEYTGALGGTLWVLAANFTGFFIFRRIMAKRRYWPHLIAFAVLILAPIGVSYMIYNSYTEKVNPVKFVVVQPNLDPYKEQYSIPPSQVVGRIMSLATPVIDSTTDFLVAPESAIQESMWENDLNTFASIRLLRNILNTYPDLNIVVGGSTFRYFEEGEPVSRTARKFTDVDKYYDAFNAAIMINLPDSMQLYHKSKLTPGVEILPSFRNFKLLEKFAINLGGTVGSLGMDSVRRVYHTQKNLKPSVVICYESIFGEFFSEFVRNGAQVMIIITNDGWWGNTPGYRQHFSFTHLRAIETRRSIARSANTGISAFINQRGDASQATAYWVPAAIKGSLNANTEITFYVRNGDYLGRMASMLTVIILVSGIVMGIIQRKRQKR
jgi:apolipoprotein N-acyltransferase